MASSCNKKSHRSYCGLDRMQCAAVKAYRLSIKTTPQTNLPLTRSNACHGHRPGAASAPPMMYALTSSTAEISSVTSLPLVCIASFERASLPFECVLLWETSRKFFSCDAFVSEPLSFETSGFISALCGPGLLSEKGPAANEIMSLVETLRPRQKVVI